MRTLNKLVKRIVLFFVTRMYGSKSDIAKLLTSVPNDNIFYNANFLQNSNISDKAKIYSKYSILDSSIGDYSYIAKNSTVRSSTIGKFCSIGPNLISGWGIHPTNGISTSPMFYSIHEQNGTTLCDRNKAVERKEITIGNDVFIGMNVTILDGVTISDGAVIGAGALVTKDVPPYAVAVGNPARVVRYRFDEETIKKLLDLKWWDWDLEKLKDVEKRFFDVDAFLKKHGDK